MLILDCSSRTQALHTLSAGFGCSPEKLKKVLLSLDLESIYELNPRQLVDAPQYLRNTSVRNWANRDHSPGLCGFMAPGLSPVILFRRGYWR